MKEPEVWESWNDVGAMFQRVAVTIGCAILGVVIIIGGLLVWVWSLVDAG